MSFWIQVLSYLKLLRAAARTEKKWGARRVGVLKVRRASRCGALIFTMGGKRGTLWQPNKNTRLD